MVLKSPEDLVRALARKFDGVWEGYAARGVGAADPLLLPWTFPLGQPSRADLQSRWPEVRRCALEWQEWSSRCGVPLQFTSRVVFGTPQDVPTHAVMPSLEVALGVLGASAAERHRRGRERAAVVSGGGLGVSPDVVAASVRAMDSWSDADVHLAVEAAAWFREHDAEGLTPRQVPLPGFHAKWLQSRKKVVTLLSGSDLGLRWSHPGRVHFTYLDPDHISCGGRRHDSVTAGDRVRPEYVPRVVLISENKDTAVDFPAVPGGVAVEGDGYGPAVHASISWLASAPVVLYWGDMDQDGYRILHQFRSAGINAQSVLMDVEAFERYARFGTSVDKQGREIVPSAVSLTTLTDQERAVYERITSAQWSGPRRIEQERIPLVVAQEAVLAAAALAPSYS